MSFLDRIVGRESQGASEKVPVSLEDLKVGIWENKKGRIRVKSLDPFDAWDYSGDQPLLFEDNLEGLRKKLEEGGYALAPEQPKGVTPEGSTGPVSAVVTDIAEARERKGTVAVKNQESNGEMEELQQQIFAKLKAMMEILQGMENEEAKAAALRLSEETSGLYQEGLTQEEETKRLRAILAQVDALSVTVEEKKPVARGSARAARRAAARSVGEVADETMLDASGTEDEGVGNVAVAHAGNLDALLRAKEIAPPAPAESEVVSPVLDTSEAAAPKKDAEPKVPAREKKPRVAKPEKEGKGEERKDDERSGEPKGPGGPEGPEGPEDFRKILEGLWTKVSGLIEALKTPEEYVAFRQEMVVLPAKEADRPARRCYFRLDDIKALVGRKITDEEMTQVNALERELEEAARKKFFTLKNADLDTQFRREQAKIDAATDEAAFVALTDAWSREPALTNIWGAVLGDLTEKERDMIADGYQTRTERLSAHLEAKRQDFRRMAAAAEAKKDTSWRKELDVFLERGPKAQEKIAMFERMIQEEYKAYSEDMYRAAIKSGGKVSTKDRRELWIQKNGEAIFEDVIVRHLERFDGIEPEEGKKIFHAIVRDLEEGANMEK